MTKLNELFAGGKALLTKKSVIAGAAGVALAATLGPKLAHAANNRAGFYNAEDLAKMGVGSSPSSPEDAQTRAAYLAAQQTAFEPPAGLGGPTLEAPGLGGSPESSAQTVSAADILRSQGFVPQG